MTRSPVDSDENRAMTAFVSVTTHSRRLKHYARPTALKPRASGGHEGVSLCVKSIHTTVVDQVAVDIETERWGIKDVVIARLPLCKRCAKTAATPASDSTPKD